jgi:predicted nucleotidyltransferase
MQSTYDQIQYYRLTENEKTKLISKLKKLLAKDERVKKAWIFGSFTRSNSFRDIDVAIQTKSELDFKEYLYFNADIELELGVPVDLVEIANAPVSLRENILKNGLLIKGIRKQ